mgnify:FL=1
MAAVDDEIYDIIVIGAGPAGLFGTFYAGLRQMRTLLVEALPEPGGQLAVLYPDKYIFDVAGYPRILARELVQALWEQATQHNPALRLGERVTRLERSADSLLSISTDRSGYRARSVLIAAGIGAFAPNRLNHPGVERLEERGIYYFVRDKSMFQGKRVLVIGGGDSAVDWALALAGYASRVILMHRREGFRAHEHSVAQVMANDAIEKRIPWEIKKVHGDSWLEAVTVFNNQNEAEETLELDAVLLNLGFKADLGAIAGWGLQLSKRAIVVDGCMATNLPGVYAAGDIAAPKDGPALNLIVTGFAQAALAVNCAKNYINPAARIFPGHSSERQL